MLRAITKIFSTNFTDTRLDAINHPANPERESITLFHNNIPIPPSTLRDMVRKGAFFAEDFILEGKNVYTNIKKVLADKNILISDKNSICEFGVGCGRVARHLDTPKTSNFLGLDVDSRLIEWCDKSLTNHLPYNAAFKVNPFQPPLEQDFAQFDLVYSISVFTHMSPELQEKWLAELTRALCQGGHLLISIIEKSHQELPNGVKTFSRTDSRFSRDWLGRNGAPNDYCTTHNTIDNILLISPANLKLINVASKAIRNKQSLLLFEKTY